MSTERTNAAILLDMVHHMMGAAGDVLRVLVDDPDEEIRRARILEVADSLTSHAAEWERHRFESIVGETGE